jgi:quaternary ammonium compound-resistance protein SugE
MAWILLVAAGALEIMWAFAMKESDGLTRLGPTALTFVAMLASVALLSLSMKTLPLSIAYPVWTGIGAVGAFAAGVIILGEAATVGRISAAVLIVAGLVLMKTSE